MTIKFFKTDSWQPEQPFYHHRTFIFSKKLEKFVLVDAEMLGKVSSHLKLATCTLDPTPTSIIKPFYSSF